MNALLNMNTGVLESDGVLIGQFIPNSHSDGIFKIESCSYTYNISAQSYGFTIAVFKNGKQVATRVSDIHDGIESIQINNFRCALNDNGVFYYNEKGKIGRISFTENQISFEFSENFPSENLLLAMVIGALDVMWANLVGFTRIKSGKVNPLLSQISSIENEISEEVKTKQWWRLW